MIRVTDRQYWMHPGIKAVLDTMIYNQPNNWDGIFLVTGSGMVRVGKTMLAQQCAYYTSSKNNLPFSLKNVVFSGKELIDTGNSLPKRSTIIYDEARSDMDPRRVSKHLIDYLSECGTYNHIMFFVMPEFFEFPPKIALNRSEGLINVLRGEEEARMKDGSPVVKWKRGAFIYMGRRSKRRMYLEGKRNSYSYESMFRYPHLACEFRPHWVLNEEDYEAKKRAYIRREREAEGPSKRDWASRLVAALLDKGMTQSELAKLSGVTQQTISYSVKGCKSNLLANELTNTNTNKNIYNPLVTNEPTNIPDE